MARPTYITIIGNLPDDPELRFTPTGLAVVKFRVIVNKRVRGANGEYEDGEATSYNCTAWRDYAEHIAETFKRGMSVIVAGEWGSRSYEDKENVKKWVWELVVDEAGPTLRWGTAEYRKASRDAQAGAPARSGSSRQKAAPAQDDAPPW